MNRIYSLVYNVTLGQVQVASELAGGAVVSTRPQQRAGWRRQVMALAVGLLVAGGGLAQTLPSGSVVASGTVTIGPASGSRLDISQASNKAVINWGSFGIGANDTVDFTTPSASAVTLNIVGAGGGISQIDGTLSSTGHVFLLNQNGVLFGDTARVNVAGLVASAAGYTYDGSLHGQGKYLFDATGQTSAVTVAAGAVLTAAGPIILLGSKVTNNGTIQSTAGAVNLFGSEVVNGGSIIADAGIITLQAGTAATLDYSGESSPVLVADPVLQAGHGVISHTGVMQAEAIHIRSPYQATAINVGGRVTAGSLLELSQGGGGMTLAGSLSSGDQVSIDSGSGSVTQTGGALEAHQLLLATEGSGQATPPPFDAARSVSLSSTANAISSISGDVAGNFEVDNSDSNGRLDQLSVAGELDLYATATVTLSNVAAGTMKASARELVVTGGVVVGGRADLTASNAALVIHGLEVGGDLLAKGVGLHQTGSFAVDGDAVLDAGTAALSLNNASVDGDLTATGSAITQTGSLAVGGTADLDSPGAIVLANVNAGALDVTTGNRLQIAGGTITGHAGLSAATSMTLTNLGTGSIIAAADALGASGLTVGTNATLTSRAAALSLGNVAVGGNLQANGVGLSQLGTLGVGGDADLNAGTAALLLNNASVDGDLIARGRAITQTGTLDVGGDADLNAGTAALSLNSASVDGDLTATGSAITQTGSLAVGGTADLDSAGAIALANVNAGALDVTTGNQLQIAGGNVTGHAGLSAATSMTLTNLGAGGIIAAADALDVSGLTVGTNATLTSRAAALSLDNVAVGGNLQANGVGLSQTGTLDVEGHATLLAGTGGLAIHNASAGGLTATGASITQTGTLTVIDVAKLDSAGDIGLANVATETLKVTAGDALTITGAQLSGNADLAAGSAMTLNNVNASSLVAKSNALSVTGGVVVGAAHLDAKNTTLLIDGFTTQGGLLAVGNGITQTGRLDVGGYASLEAGSGDVAIHNVTAGSHLIVSGASITQTGTASVAGRAELDTSGAITLADVDAAALTATADDTLQIAKANVTGHAALTANNTMTLGNVNAGSLTAASNALSLSTGVIDGAANLAVRGTLQLTDSLSVGGDLTATGVGINQIGTLHVDGDVTLEAGNGNLVINNVTVGQNLVATGAGISQSGTLLVTGTADLDSTGAIALANVTAAALDASSGDQLQLDGATVSGDVVLAAAGEMHLTGVSADGVTATSNGLAISGLQVGRNASLDAGSSTLGIDGLVVGGDLLARGEGMNQQGSFHVVGNAALNAGTAALSLHNATVDGNLTATGSAITQTGALAVGGTADLESTGAIALANVTAAALDASSGDQLQLDGATVSGDVVLAAAGEMHLTGVSADGVTASSNGLAISGLQVGRNASLDAGSSTLGIDGLAVGGDLLARGEGMNQQGSFHVVGNAALNAGTAALSLHSATVEGNLTASGAAITQAGSLAVGGDADLDAGAAALLLNNATVDGSLTATGSAITQTGALAVGGTADLDSAGAIALANVTAAALDASSGDQLQLDGATVSGDVVLAAAGEMHLTGVSADGVTASSNGLAISGLQVGRNASLDAGSSTLGIDGLAVGGDLLARGEGMNQQGSFHVVGNAALNAGTASLTLNNATVDGNLTATGSAITQTGALAVGGTADLDSAGAIALANVTAAALDVTTGNRLQIAGGNVTGRAGLSAATSMTLSNLGAGSIIAAADALDVSGLTIGTNATLTSRAAALSLGNVSVGGNLQANGVGLSQTGTLDVGGDATLDAGTTALSLHNATVDGNLTATGSAITQTGALAVAGTADLDSTGAIALANVTAAALDASSGDQLQLDGATVSGDVVLAAAGEMHLTGVSADGVTASSNGLAISGLQVGRNASLDAGSSTLGIDGLAVGGDLLARGEGMNQQGSFHVVGNAALNAGTAALSLHNATVEGNLTASGAAITQAGSLAVGGDADLDAGAAALLLNNATVDGSLTATGSAITQTGTLAVAGTADLDSTGAIALANVTAAALDASSGDQLQLDGATVSGDVVLAAAGEMHLTGVSADGVTASSNGLAISGLQVGRNASLDAGSSTLGIDGLAVGGDLLARGEGMNQQGSFHVVGNAALNAGTAALSLHNATVEGNLTASGAAITQAGSLAVGGDADLDAGAAALLLNNATVDGNLTATGSAITQTGTLAVGGTADLDSTGTIALANVTADVLDVTAGDQLLIHGGTVTGHAGLSAATSIALSNLGVGSITAAADALSASGLTVGTNAALTSHTAALSLENVAVGGKLQASGLGLRQTGALDVGGDAALDAGTGALFLNDVIVGGNLQANGVGLHQTGTLDVGGDAALDAGTAALSLNNVAVGGNLQANGVGMSQTGTLDVGGDTDLDAGTAVLSLNNASLDGDLTATGSAITQTGSLAVGGTADLDSAGAIALSNVTAGALDVTTGDQLQIAGATVAGGATLDAAGELKLADMFVGGQLRAAASAISQSGALSVGRSSELQAAGRIVLDHAGNQFTGPVALRAQQASIVSAAGLELASVDVADLQARAGGQLAVGTANIAGVAHLSGNGVLLGAVTVGSDLQVDSAAGIAQQAALQVHGDTLLSAGGVIALEHAGNDFVGGVAAQGASIRLVDRNALDLQALGNHGGSGEIHVLAAGDLGVAGQGVDAGTGNLSLQSVGGRIVQSAGQVVAGHLQVAAQGAVDLQGDNRIAALGDVSADGLKLVSHGDLRVSGNVQAGSDVMLEVHGGSLQLDGQLSASQLRLLSEGNIVQGSSSLLQADTLSGRSGGSTVLGTGAGFVANQVAMLGDFSAAGGFSLTNARSLSLGALNGSAFSVNAGTADLMLKVDGGDLLQSGQVPVLAGMSYWWSSGRIGTLLDPIHLVTSTGILQVDYVGAPPAYFHATTPAGVPVVVTGGVNALSFDVVAREQAGAMWRQPPLGLPAGGEQAAPIRLDGPGMALPAKPATACAASTADTLCMQ